LDANDTFLRLLGFTHDDLLAGRIANEALTPPEYRATDEWAQMQLREFGVSPTVEKEFVRKDGTRIPVLVGAVFQREPQEELVCFVIDVTERRQALRALQKAYDEIELRVTARTAELVRANAELAREVVRRKKAETELRSLSLRDPLTGLYNRRGFLALAEQQWLLAYRDKREFLFFFADVDGLKQINDTLGHAEGDHALILAAKALRQSFRKSDILARIGGDEFAVVATRSPWEKIQTYLDRIQDCLDQENAESGLPFTLRLSIGVASSDSRQLIPLQEMMKRADQNLYQRRQLVRNS
jgi:diguanylate cyclase (GGDEF)-like protein/PAS domain S-box-containing protein